MSYGNVGGTCSVDQPQPESVSLCRKCCVVGEERSKVALQQFTDAALAEIS